MYNRKRTHFERVLIKEKTLVYPRLKAQDPCEQITRGVGPRWDDGNRLNWALDLWALSLLMMIDFVS